MADKEEKVIAEEKPAEDAKDDSYVYARDHKKSTRQVALETRKRNIKVEEEVKDEDATVDTPPDKERKEEKEPEKKEESKVEEPKVDPQEIADKAARKAAEETRKEFQAKIDEILNKDKVIEEKQKEADELVAIWEKEERLPKDWKEIASEQLRISNVKLEQRLKEQEETRKKSEEEQQNKVKQDQEETQKRYEARIEEVQNKALKELEELYENKFLAKPADISKTDAEDMKETNELITFAIDLNKKRVEQKLEPIDSVSKIYFMHYKPFKDAQPGNKGNQPAGADAPVAGPKVAQAPQETRGYVYARDHNKSYRQLLVEAQQRAKRS